MNIEPIYPEDVKRENERIASCLKEEQLSEFSFNGEPLYLIGQGHEFVYGHYNQYLTKSAKPARYYILRNFWCIEGEDYEYVDNEFVLLPKKEYKSLSLEDVKEFKFPIIKSTIPKIISNDLISVQPLMLPKKK